MEDDPVPKPPTLAWVQSQCREGLFRHSLDKFIAEQAESMSANLVLVETVEPGRIVGRIPCRVADSESTSTFAMDVQFELNPLTQEIKRLI